MHDLDMSYQSRSIERASELHCHNITPRLATLLLTPLDLPALHFPHSYQQNRNTSSLKWSKYGADILPLWVADMDFRAPQCVIDAMHARAEHGVYGYSIPKEEVTMEVVKYLKRTAHYQVRIGIFVYLLFVFLMALYD